MRITWDMTVVTDKRLKHNRPDITVLHKDTQEWTIIDSPVPLSYAHGPYCYAVTLTSKLRSRRISLQNHF